MLTGRTSKVLFALILALVTLAFFNILRPYVSPVLWAAILAVIFYKTKIWISRATGGRNGIASLLTLLLICLIVFTPLVIVTSSLASELNTVYRTLQNDNASMSSLFNDVVSYLPDWARRIMADYQIDNLSAIRSKLSAMALQGSQYAAGSVLLISRNTFSLAIGFGVMLYLLFFFLKDGARLVEMIFKAIPLDNHMKYRLFARFAAVARATVKGTIVVAVVQGVLGGIAFWAAGIEASLLWGALMAFLSLIPAVGTALIWVPAAIYLFATGLLLKGILLTLWFVVVVGLSDNLLRPLLVGKDIRMPDWLILIATLGGLSVYGINGFVIGPLIAALFVTCWNYFYLADSEKRRITGDDPLTPGQKEAGPTGD
ncbi:AI-2E family transporter [Siccibacter turicensis]|uniref:AI-2E family transporter n=1 Tax=Siccibacter turicensis TaxID=357233 RepID=UPI003F56FDD0